MNNIERDESINVQDAINQAKHGDYVQTEDGGYGIVIDDAVEREAKKPEGVKKIENALAEQHTSLNNIKENKTVDSLVISENIRKAESDTVKEFKDNPKLHEHYDAIKKLSEEAEKWEPSMDGIAPAGSIEAKKFDTAIKPTENGGFDVSGVDINALKKDAVDKFNEEQHKKEMEERQRTENIAQDFVNEQEGNSSVTQFNVPEGHVRSFVETLPDETMGKVSRSKSIVVNEIKKRDVPTKKRKITDFSEFKRVVSRKIHSEIESVALPNSGFYATFKGCGSLAMATLVPDNQNAPIDYAKRYQFVYDNLVSTSIGKLSFVEFCSYVSVDDLDLCIFAILRASDPDENSVTLVCGNDDCRREYEVKYRLSQLIDPDSITDETLEQTKRIVDAKDIYENARKVFEDSPMMQIKSIDITNDDGSVLTVDIKRPNGTTVIERSPIMQDIAKTVNPYVSAMLLYVPSASLTITEDGDDDPTTYETDDPESIASLIGDLDDDSLKVISEILKDMTEFPSPTYSFKGQFECPSCHRRETSIECNVNTLVFQKVSKAIQ